MVSSRIVVVDDLRSFNAKSKSQLDAESDLRYARTSEEGLKVLKECFNEGLYIHQLWLDHDLGGLDTVVPIVDWLTRIAGQPASTGFIQTILVHTSNPVGDSMVRTLRHYNYKTWRVLAETYFTATNH